MTSGVNGCSSVKTSDAQVSASERRERTRLFISLSSGYLGIPLTAALVFPCDGDIETRQAHQEGTEPLSQSPRRKHNTTNRL
jgi:hypothetical protein